MLIAQIYTANNYRNFSYLIGCSETGEALAIDPLAYDMCIEEANRRNWKITSVVNTHEHFDHIGGNQKLIDKTGAKLYAHIGAKDKIPYVDIGLSSGETIKIGKTVELEVLDTPGHTMTHICLLSRGSKEALFSGDTLFNAGVGNCHNGGDPEHLYETFYKKIFNLNPNTLIYPGHDYIENNLNFSLNVEPKNIRANTLLNQIKQKTDMEPFVTTLSIEFEINSFFRLDNMELISNLIDRGEISDGSQPKETFLALRRLRNSW